MWRLGDRQKCSGRPPGASYEFESARYVCSFRFLAEYTPSDEIRCVADKTKSEQSSKLSDRNSYIAINHNDEPDPICELVVIPGRRKFWKWVDFGFADAEKAIVVTRPRSGETVPQDVIVWLALALLHDMKDVLIIINNFENLPEEEVDEFEKNIRTDVARIVTDDSVTCTILRLPSQPTSDDLHPLHTFLPTPPRNQPNCHFHMSINLIHAREGSVIVGGKILGGTVSTDDSSLMLLPSRIPLKATSIHTVGNRSVSRASSGEVVGIFLDNLSHEHVETGMIIAKSDEDLDGTSTRSFTADVNFFNTKFIINQNFCPVLSIHCFQTLAKIVSIHKPAHIGDCVRCTFSLNKTAFVQVFDSTKNRPYSRIILRQENIVIALGVIREVVS